MSDKVFLDSNIILYSYSNSELEKQVIAKDIISNQHTVISTQVLQELTNVALKKLNFPHSKVLDALNECIQNNQIFVNTIATITHAVRIAAKEKFSFYDSLIISAAIESNCSILYSEDLQSGRKINGSITIVNPFKEKS